jgi:hypothetical protein
LIKGEGMEDRLLKDLFSILADAEEETDTYDLVSLGRDGLIISVGDMEYKIILERKYSLGENRIQFNI